LNASVQGINELSVDTNPYVQCCIISAFCNCHPSTKFCDFSDSPYVQHAAIKQDHIGWDQFMKGQVSKQWRLLQDEHYHTNASKCTPRIWIEGLVSHILLLVNKQWTTHDEVVNAHTEKGIKVHEAAELESAINKQFSLHTNGLLPQDHHLSDRGCIAVDQMSAIGKKTWLQSIIITTCEIYESEIELATTQLQNQISSWKNRA
jgi:hypothetical protein